MVSTKADRSSLHPNIPSQMQLSTSRKGPPKYSSEFMFLILSLNPSISQTLAPKINSFSSPTSSQISTFAPSIVPKMMQPFMTNFMLLVPEASRPAVEMCQEISDPGIIIQAEETLQLGKKTTFKNSLTDESLLILSATALTNLMILFAVRQPGAALPPIMIDLGYQVSLLLSHGVFKMHK